MPGGAVILSCVREPNRAEAGLKAKAVLQLAAMKKTAA